MLCCIATCIAGCEGDVAPDPWAKRTLLPYDNPFGPGDPLWAPQPHRDRPRAAALSADGGRLYVALTGAEDVPGDAVAVVDLARRAVVRRVPVGSAPVALALHPGGRFLAVAALYTNRVTVIDTQGDTVAAEVPAPFYTSAIAFSPDGRTAWLANRWKDALLRWDVRAGDRFEVIGDDYRALPLDAPAARPVATNPAEVLVAPGGNRVYVGSVAGQSVDVFDGAGARVGRIAVGSPVGGMALAGRFLVVTHIGRGNGYPPAEGFDGDDDGAPGDGTANVMFQDLQNEIEVFDTTTLASAGAYTSDTICCRDYRDVDPDDPTRGLAIPAPETWPPERLAALPPRSRWIVAGALPTRMARIDAPRANTTRLLVVMSASNEAQRFDVDETTGAVTAVDAAGRLYPTGHAPADVVARPGGPAYVVERLGEGVTVVDPTRSPAPAPDRFIVGDVAAGPFPASDVELGELFNAVTAPLTVDGDQSCVHCHRDGGNLVRTVAMPLQADRLWGTRQVQAYRGAFDTRPWFVEAAMDEKNFFPVLNEFDRKENFCCEQDDPLVWSRYPPLTTCLADNKKPGCNHVLQCKNDPPPECAARRYGAAEPTRDAFFLARAQALAGRRTSFGDSLRLPGTSEPIALNFDGITRALGLFLLASPRLPPNPNAALDLPSVARGRALYLRQEVGCATCHPLPLGTIASEPAFNPAGLFVRFPPVVTPTLSPGGAPADLITQGFRDTFIVAGIGPTEQGPEGIHLGVPQLRGLWDRAPRFFHDGRSRSLAAALVPPGHPAVPPGERGANERYGVVDTHGGTSHLTPAEVQDLIDFLLTL